MFDLVQYEAKSLQDETGLILSTFRRRQKTQTMKNGLKFGDRYEYMYNILKTGVHPHIAFQLQRISVLSNKMNKFVKKKE